MVEFIGFVATQPQSEAFVSPPPVIDPAYLRALARVHERAGFDRVLIGYFSAAPDGMVVAGQVLAATERLAVMIAHRSGFVAPPVAARAFATLDQFSGGRVGMHAISGGSEREQRADGDWIDKAARYRRTDEFLTILKAIWSAKGPIDFDGEFYRVRGAFSLVKPVQQPHIPIYFGGSSDDALAVAAKHADTYAFSGEPLAGAREHIAALLAACEREGRRPNISMSFRPILGRTDAEAWDRAHRILTNINATQKGPATPPPSVDAQRLLDAARQAEVHDRCLWTAPAAAMNGRGNTTALVGSVETVAQALLAYHALGVNTFLIRGFAPFDDAVQYGEQLIPIVRQEIARREAVLA